MRINAISSNNYRVMPGARKAPHDHIGFFANFFSTFSSIIFKLPVFSFLFALSLLVFSGCGKYAPDLPEDAYCSIDRRKAKEERDKVIIEVTPDAQASYPQDKIDEAKKGVNTVLDYFADLGLHNAFRTFSGIEINGEKERVFSSDGKKAGAAYFPDSGHTLIYPADFAFPFITLGHEISHGIDFSLPRPFMEELINISWDKKTGGLLGGIFASHYSVENKNIIVGGMAASRHNAVEALNMYIIFPELFIKHGMPKRVVLNLFEEDPSWRKYFISPDQELIFFKPDIAENDIKLGSSDENDKDGKKKTFLLTALSLELFYKGKNLTVGVWIKENVFCGNSPTLQNTQIWFSYCNWFVYDFNNLGAYKNGNTCQKSIMQDIFSGRRGLPSEGCPNFIKLLVYPCISLMTQDPSDLLRKIELMTFMTNSSIKWSEGFRDWKKENIFSVITFANAYKHLDSQELQDKFREYKKVSLDDPLQYRLNNYYRLYNYFLSVNEIDRAKDLLKEIEGLNPSSQDKELADVWLSKSAVVYFAKLQLLDKQGEVKAAEALIGSTSSEIREKARGNYGGIFPEDVYHAIRKQYNL